VRISLLLLAFAACTDVEDAGALPDAEEPLGTAVDADGDGVDDRTDCDDDNPDAFPGGREVCDGVDNDCDGAIDELYVRVPGDAETLEDAVDLADDGATLCVRPGIYTPDRMMDLTERYLSFESAGGDNPFDVHMGKVDGPLFELSTGTVAFRHMRIGGDSPSTGAAFLAATGGLVVFRDVSLKDAMLHAASLTLFDRGALSWEGGEVRGNTWDATGAETPLRGGVVQANSASHVRFADVVFSENLVRAASTTEGLDVGGVFLRAATTPLELWNVAFEDNAVTLEGHGTALFSGMVLAVVGWLDASAVRFERNEVFVSATAAAAEGLLTLRGGPHELLDLHFSDNLTHVRGSWSAMARGMVDCVGCDAEITDMVASRNEVRADGPSGQVQGAVVRAQGRVSLRHLDARDNLAVAEDVRGGVVDLQLSGNPSFFGSSVIAGNEVESEVDREAGALHVDCGNASGELDHLTVVGNRATNLARGGGVQTSRCEGHALSFHHTLVAENRGLSSLSTCTGCAFFPNNHGAYFQDTEDVEHGFMTPRLDGDSLDWNLRLAGDSIHRDVSSGFCTDVDGTACDRGAYGGQDPLSSDDL